MKISPFSNFVQPLPPILCLQPPPAVLFLLSSFFDWMGGRATFDVLFYLMILYIYTCWALIPLYQKDLALCFIQQGVKFTEVWHIMQFLASTLIWYHTDTQTRHTAHSGANKLTHSYKSILTPPIMCSQQLCVLQWMNNSLISKNYFRQCICFLKFNLLLKSYICWLDSIRVSSSRETQAKLIKMM